MSGVLAVIWQGLLFYFYKKRRENAIICCSVEKIELFL